MAIYTGPGGILPLSGVGGTAGNGDFTIWNNDAGIYSYLPYSQGTDKYQVLFYNSGGYGRAIGTCYWYLSISQVHNGSFQFYVSRYGGAITEHFNTGFASFSIETSINSNVNHNGIKWTNTNTNNWGNGYLYTTVVYHGEANTFVSGNFNATGQTNYTHGNSNTFLYKVI